LRHEFDSNKKRMVFWPMPSYRNISFATADSVVDVLDRGADVVVRGQVTRELVSRLTTLERPLERYPFLPKRHNDVFAQFAENVWVLAGRNDIAWLSRYLPRAPDYSDDGRTWHGAYGPRLRRWASDVDQVDRVRRLLSEDQASRRAVMVLFDPIQDFVDSKDVPCNNWLSWIAREGKLHLSVAIRSNDAMWGFSGVNAFEWSILQELMAFWLGFEVGSARYFATSFHLYENHFNRARQIGQGFHGLTPYDFGIGRAAFQTHWNDFSGKLDQWFALEEQIYSKPDGPLFVHGRTGDPLLDSGIALVQVCWAHKQWGVDRLANELAVLPSEDYVAAIYEQLGRTYPALMQNIAQPSIARFFEACRNRNLNLPNEFKCAVKRLHARKDRAYGSAWKRRGELVSILPNIARKCDRLETIVTTGSKMSGETMLDTAIDLLVYVEKYRLFLAEGLDEGALLPPGSPQPLSDHDANFEVLVDRLDLAITNRGAEELVREIVDRFNTCLHQAEADASRAERLSVVGLLAESAGRLVARLVAEDKAVVARFIQSELSS
jgi:thymidylate synthase